MQIGGGEEMEKESSGGFQFEAVDFDPCFIKNIDIKVIAYEVVDAIVVLIARTTGLLRLGPKRPVALRLLRVGMACVMDSEACKSRVCVQNFFEKWGLDTCSHMKRYTFDEFFSKHQVSFTRTHTHASAASAVRP